MTWDILQWVDEDGDKITISSGPIFFKIDFN
jgi:hypothetical protein